MTAKLNKYLLAYALTYDKMPGGSDFTTIDNWFTDIVEWCDAGIDDIFNANIGEVPPFASIPRPINNSFVQQNYSGATYTYYDSSGNNGVNLIGRLQSTTCNNRAWDAWSFLGNYGTHFNNATYRDKNFELFKYYFQVGVFPDGTSNEWYRAMDGFTSSIGFNYITVVAGHIAHNCQLHAVAVTNGLPGVSDVGKYYDYTTSIGTDELITSYLQTSTSGGAKGPFQYFDNWRRYFLTPVNGGFEGQRFTDSAEQINAYSRPYTGVVTMMNGYYNNQSFSDWVDMDTNEGFKYGNLAYPGTYPDGTSIGSAGSWGEPGLGLTWGLMGAMGGNFAQRGMEGIIFSGSPAPTPTPVNSNGALIYLLNL